MSNQIQVAQQDPAITVHGEGERLFEVEVVLQTTAFRMIHMRASSQEDAEAAALKLAEEDQSAYFEMNEGNFIDHDDLHVNHIEEQNVENEVEVDVDVDVDVERPNC
jgi:hypothetical protein